MSDFGYLDRDKGDPPPHRADELRPPGWGLASDFGEMQRYTPTTPTTTTLTYGSRKEAPMSQTRDALIQQAQILLQKVAAMDARPDEPMPEQGPSAYDEMSEADDPSAEAIPPVIYFRKGFSPGHDPHAAAPESAPGEYFYVFVRVDKGSRPGRWYGTGPKAPKGYTWDELMHWLEASGPIPDIYLMTSATVLQRKTVNYNVPQM
jgi:hypothetical protein